MEAIYCVQCKNILETSDIFCKSCGADQRPPQQRPVVSQSVAPKPVANPVPPAYGTPLPINVQPSERQVSWGLTLVGGSIYFFIEGWWKAGLASLGMAIFTGGLSWFIVPFFAQAFVDGIEGKGEQAQVVGGKPQDNLAALQQLADLRSQNIISEEEYEAKRRELLQRV